MLGVDEHMLLNEPVFASKSVSTSAHEHIAFGVYAIQGGNHNTKVICERDE